MKIFLVRHGDSLQRVRLSYEEGTKMGLTPLGQKQALRVARYLKRQKITRLITSPFARTFETAVIIGQVLNLPVKPEDRFREWTPSPHLTGEAIKEAHLKARQEFDFRYPDGETFNESYRRFMGALTDVSKDPTTIACIVSHEMVIQNVLKKLFNLGDFPPLGLVSVTLLVYDDSRWKLVFLNKKFFLLTRVFIKLKNVFFH